jgi:hypothetical protein
MLSDERDVPQRITEYLTHGGLLNPEMMDPYTTRDLLIEAKTEIDRLKAELNGAYERAAKVAETCEWWTFTLKDDDERGPIATAIRNLKEPT